MKMRDYVLSLGDWHTKNSQHNKQETVNTRRNLQQPGHAYESQTAVPHPDFCKALSKQCWVSAKDICDGKKGMCPFRFAAQMREYAFTAHAPLEKTIQQ